MRDDSKCRKNVYCEFELSRDLPDATIEVCIRCAKKVVYNKDIATGRIDNAKYLRDHFRYTVQPFGKTKNIFYQIYGDKPVKELEKWFKMKKSKNQIQSNWDAMRADLRNRLKRQIL